MKLIFKLVSFLSFHMTSIPVWPGRDSGESLSYRNKRYEDMRFCLEHTRQFCYNRTGSVHQLYQCLAHLSAPQLSFDGRTGAQFRGVEWRSHRHGGPWIIFPLWTPVFPTLALLCVREHCCMNYGFSRHGRDAWGNTCVLCPSKEPLSLPSLLSFTCHGMCSRMINALGSSDRAERKRKDGSRIRQGQMCPLEELPDWGWSPA